MSRPTGLRLGIVALACATAVLTPVASDAAAGPSCARTMNVVAHEDDDLLFLNPAIVDDISALRCVTTVFVTAGDAGRGQRYWRGRERGAMAAYATMARKPNRWAEDTLTVSGQKVHRAILDRSKITLLFMRIPDKYGAPFKDRLRTIWMGNSGSPTIKTVDGRTTYTRDTILRTVVAMMNSYRPQDIRTLDYTHPFTDGDHEDHHVAGMIAEAAAERYQKPHTITAYQGYDIRFIRPGELTAKQTAIKYAAFHAYAVPDGRVCQTLAKCQADPNYWGYLVNQRVLTTTAVNGK